ncbi:MAG: hypothetical protein HRU15_13845 [Planctomycetes bacterium]|nr:hypothetical protein [Planctomycetota bacterium]
MRYNYILKKIKEAIVLNSPFEHIQINNLFKREEFEEIIKCSEIKTELSENDDELFKKLFESGYRIIGFPGCTQNQEEYTRWHKTKTTSHIINTSCEGFGVALRLVEARSPYITELMVFLDSAEFKTTIAEKFGLKIDECSYDQGVQKYLDGYEISPHPDIRKKALTYMVNINPHTNSEKYDHHTHYLKFKPEWRYVEEYWKENNKLDTCWVPWEWCITEKQQIANNSLVMFSPNSGTLHGVKANYNHLIHQRTQLYGNLWYNVPPHKETHWEDYIVKSKKVTSKQKSTPGRTKGIISISAKLIKKMLRYTSKKKIIKNKKSSKTHAKRNHNNTH